MLVKTEISKNKQTTPPPPPHNGDVIRETAWDTHTAVQGSWLDCVQDGKSRQTVQARQTVQLAEESKGRHTSSSSAFPSYISWVHHFWVRFLRMWPFFNPTMKVIPFRLRGWCVLGVFLLSAFTRLGHGTSGSFESVRWNACVHRLDLGLYFHLKEFLGEWSLNPC